MTYSLEDPSIMKEVIIDNYQNPKNYGLVDDNSYKKINMNSKTCLDNVDIQAKFDGDKVEDVRFDGEACAICTASSSIMTELLKGKTKEEAVRIVNNYMGMIYEKDYDSNLLKEAIVFKNTYKQPNRIKCATLGWVGIKKLLKESEGN